MQYKNLRGNGFFLEGSSDKAVLLIHGITGTPAEMRYLAKHLQKSGFNVLCNTFPGHCATLEELRRVTWEEIYSALKEDLSFLKNNYKKVFVAGLSMGATLAIYLASDFPQAVSGIVALAPTIFYDGWNVTRKRALLPLFWWFKPVRYSWNVKETWPYGLKNELLRESVDRFYKLARVNHNAEEVSTFGSPFIPVACLYQLERFNKAVKPRIPSVTAAILIIHAQEDDMVSVKNAYYIHDRIASRDKSVVILKDSYHMISIDQEKRKVAQEMINFLSRL